MVEYTTAGGARTMFGGAATRHRDGPHAADRCGGAAVASSRLPVLLQAGVDRGTTVNRCTALRQCIGILYILTVCCAAFSGLNVIRILRCVRYKPNIYFAVLCLNDFSRRGNKTSECCRVLTGPKEDGVTRFSRKL